MVYYQESITGRICLPTPPSQVQDSTVRMIPASNCTGIAFPCCLLGSVESERAGVLREGAAL
eukprot:3768895-Rhodomonas_salina.1